MIEFNATLIVAMLSFVVFMFIMNAIFYKPVLSIIRKRDVYIKSNYDEANELALKTHNCINERSAKLEEAKNNCRKNVAEYSDKIQRKAFDEIYKEKANAKAQLQSAKNELDIKAQELQSKVDEVFVNELSDVIVDKIMKGVR